VGDIVLAEVVRVLGSGYRLPRARIADTIRELLEAGPFTFESVDRVGRALVRYRQGDGGFADYLILETALDQGASRLASFGRALGGSPEVFEP